MLFPGEVVDFAHHTVSLPFIAPSGVDKGKPPPILLKGTGSTVTLPLPLISFINHRLSDRLPVAE